MGMCEKLEVTRSYESTWNAFKGVKDECLCQAEYLQNLPSYGISSGPHKSLVILYIFVAERSVNKRQTTNVGQDLSFQFFTRPKHGKSNFWLEQIFPCLKSTVSF